MFSAQNVPAEKETLTPTQQLNEYLMIALRTKEGIDLQQVAAWGFEKVEALQKKAVKYTNSQLINEHNNRLLLKAESMLRADGIAADLLF